MLPFTRDAFLGVFAACNTATWPAEPVAYAAAALAVAAAWSGRPWAGRIVAAVLSAMWLWTGIVYHWICFAPVNPAAHGFAAGFVLQAGLLAWHGGRLAFAPPAMSPRGIAAVALMLYAAVLYPLVGLAAGHVWPARPAFGTTPCPLVIFSFGLLLLARGTLPWALLALPVLWAAIGGSAAVLLDVPQDYALPLSALAALALRRAPPAVRNPAS